MEQARFLIETALLFDRLTELKGPDGLYDWINMFVKVPFEAIGNEDTKEKIKQKAVASLRPKLYIDGKWYADYVRLRMKAIKI